MCLPLEVTDVGVDYDHQLLDFFIIIIILEFGEDALIISLFL